MSRSIRRNKTKFILRKELVILVLALVAMIVTTICLSIPSAKEKRLEEFNNAITAYNTANSTSYSTLTEDSVIYKASLNKIDSEIKAGLNGTTEEPKYVYVLYGTLSNATICQYLSSIDNEAQQRDVKNVYLYSSEKVDNQEDKDDVEFLAELENDEKIFNSKVLEGVEEVDLLNTPALYVFKNGQLVFNSYTLEDDGSYNWELIINKAFSK